MKSEGTGPGQAKETVLHVADCADQACQKCRE